MDQRTDNWHAWRNGGIGSSDAPVIMGVSPWRTPYELWEEKTGRVQRDQTPNWAADRGNQLEPIARARYELECDIEMGPALCQHNELPMLRASMDGWNPAHARGLEIKCPGLGDHETAESGRVPEKYWPQLQHQFLVSGAAFIDYYSYYVPKDALGESGRGRKVETRPDPDYIRQLLLAELTFWGHVTSGIPPALTDRDFKLIRVAGAKAKADEYVRAMAAKNQAVVDLLRPELLALGSSYRRAKIGELRIMDGEIHWHGQGQGTQV